MFIVRVSCRYSTCANSCINNELVLSNRIATLHLNNRFIDYHQVLSISSDASYNFTTVHFHFKKPIRRLSRVTRSFSLTNEEKNTEQAAIMTVKK